MTEAILQTHWRSTPVRLGKGQKRFIQENHDRLSVVRMARRLKIPPAEVRRAVQRLELEASQGPKASGKSVSVYLEPTWAKRLRRRLEFLNRYGLAFCLVVSLALVLRLIHLYEVADTPFFLRLHTDPAMYNRWAGEIIKGDWAGHSRPVFYLGPLYPYFLAVIYSVFGVSQLAACLVQVVLSSLSAGLVYHLGRRLFGSGAGLIAGLAASCYGMFIFFSSLILGATLIIFLDLLMLVLLVSGLKKPAWWRWMLAGACFGLSAAARGNVVLFGPLAVLAIMAYFGCRAWRKWLPACAWLTLAFFVTISPLALHNRLVGGDFVPLTYNAGPNFFIGNNAHSDGIYIRAARYQGRPMGLSAREQELNFAEVAERELGREDLEKSELSRFWIGKTFEEIGSDVPRWLRLVGHKLRYVFNAYEVPNNRNYYFSQRFSVLLRLWLLTFGVALPFGVMGIILSWRSWRHHGLLLGFLLAHVVALAAFFVNGRYRLVMVPIVIVYGAAMLPWLWTQVVNRRYLRVVVVSVLLALGYVGAYLRVPKMNYRANFANLANAYRHLGSPEKALENYDHAIARWPNYYYAHLKKGEILRELDRKAEARASFERALELVRRNNDQLNIRRIEGELRELDGS